MPDSHTMTETPRLFAVVPAAGHSRRMGRPKLLLPLGTKTVIELLLEVLDHPGITETVVVVRPDDQELRTTIANSAATLLEPSNAPPEMRDSVELALSEIRRRHAPSAGDGWLLVPADHPMLNSPVFDALIQRWNRGDCRILVPTFEHRRGHPTFFGWELADEVSAIPGDHGLNWLLQQHAAEVVEMPVDNRAVVFDLDSPGDYDKLLANWDRDSSARRPNF